MTKKVLILSLNYSSTPAIALSGRINIAVNARGVFIADYGILEENITYLSDEWAPLTKAQIMTAVQALVDESTSLEEIYIYYAGYGSGIQIVKSIDWALMPETLPMDIPPMDIPPMDIPPMDIPPSDSLPVDDSTITITIDELEPTTTVPVEPTTEAPIVPTTEAPTEPTTEPTTEPSSSEPTTEEAPTEPSSEAPTEPTVPTTEAPTEPIVPTIDPLFPPVIPQEPIVPTIDPMFPPQEPVVPPIIPSFIVPSPEPPPAPEPPPYKYDFYPMSQSYDKLTKQMVGSDYEIITNSEILDMLKNTKCRTICVLDMCPLVVPTNGMTEPVTEPLTNKVLSSETLTWGTDIIGNVNIISFAEPDSISSGKLATIQVITQHLFTNPVL